MAAQPSVRRIPPKKLHPSNLPPRLSGCGCGAAVLGVLGCIVVVVVVGAVVVVVEAVVDVVVVEVVVDVVVVVVVVEVVVLPLSVVVGIVVVGTVVSGVSVVVVVVVLAGLTVVSGSSPFPALHSCSVLNSSGLSPSFTTSSVASWHFSESWPHWTSMQPWVATQARQSVCRLVWLQEDEEEVGRPDVRPHQSRAASRRLAGVPMLVAWAVYPLVSTKQQLPAQTASTAHCTKLNCTHCTHDRYLL